MRELLGGHDPQRVAQQQQAVERLAAEALRQAMNTPSETRRLNLNAVAVGSDQGVVMLLVALPTGQRIEIPLNDQSQATIIRELNKLRAGDQSTVKRVK